MKKLRSVFIVSALAVMLLMALSDTFGPVSYEQMMVFLRLRAPAFTSAGLTVHFIDVGQGDSTLIVSGEHAVLIDAGEEESGGKVVSYLVSQNIEYLDCIIATHPHSDHTGGLKDVLKSTNTGEIIVPHISAEGRDAETLYSLKKLGKLCEDTGTVLTEAYPGMKIDLGESELEILAPFGEYDNINNYSVVTELTHGNNRFLFPGDAESESEAEMLRNGVLEDIDVLKAGHHGSQTSSGGDFLETVRPEYAVVSCGAGNSYNHPSGKVMKSFAEYGTEVFRTDLQGSIIAESDGKTICFAAAGREQAGMIYG